jgi:hypothetical protein
LFIVSGIGYVVLGLVGAVPLELTGTGLTNIRTPSGVAVVGCLIAAFSTKDR